MHLPHFLTKDMVYKIMEESLGQQGFSHNEIISRSHFYSIWRQNFKHTVIPKVKHTYVHIIDISTYCKYVVRMCRCTYVCSNTYNVERLCILFCLMQTNLFSKCDQCVLYKQERLLKIDNRENIQVLERRYHEHLKRVQ